MMNRDNVEVVQGRVAQGYLGHEQETVWFLEGYHVSWSEQNIWGTRIQSRRLRLARFKPSRSSMEGDRSRNRISEDRKRSRILPLR